MDNQPPYQERPSAPPPPPPESGFTGYPAPSSLEYPQPGQGYGPPPGYAPSGPGYGSPPGYAPSGPGYGSPPGYVAPGPGYVPSSGYAPQPVGMYAPAIPDPGKGMAITGFVMGIVSILLLCTFWGSLINLIVGGLGITFSVIGRKSSTSRGLAIAGLVMSIIGVVISVVFVIIIIGIFAAAAANPPQPQPY